MRVAFVVPCHGRHRLAEACLRQLQRTCSELAAGGLDASAILVGSDPVFARIADELGFGYFPSANSPLGRKWNDGFEFACRDGRADYVIPFGSDDIIDAALLLSGEWPAAHEMRCCRLSAVVHPSGGRLAELAILYPGGDGVRIIPAELLRRVGYRPAGEERQRGIDGSIADRLLVANGRRPRFVYHDLHPLQLVDWKSTGPNQRNSYHACLDFATAEHGDVFERVGEHFPAGFVDEMRALYAPRSRRKVAA